MMQKCDCKHERESLPKLTEEYAGGGDTSMSASNSISASGDLAPAALGCSIKLRADVEETDGLGARKARRDTPAEERLPPTGLGNHRDEDGGGGVKKPRETRLRKNPAESERCLYDMRGKASTSPKQMRRCLHCTRCGGWP
jgi:hypothetical protein